MKKNRQIQYKQIYKCKKNRQIQYKQFAFVHLFVLYLQMKKIGKYNTNKFTNEKK